MRPKRNPLHFSDDPEKGAKHPGLSLLNKLKDVDIFTDFPWNPAWISPPPKKTGIFRGQISMT